MKLPNSPEAELGFIGCCLIDPGKCVNAAIENGVTPEFFFNTALRRLYDILVSLINLGHPVTELSVIEAHGGDKFHAAELIRKAIDATPSAENHEYFREILVDFLCRRSAISASYQTIKEAMEAGMDFNRKSFLARIQERFFAINPEDSQPQTIKDLARNLLDEFEASQDGKPMIKSVRTGISDLDRITDGFVPGNLITVAARPGRGKTSWGTNITTAVAVGSSEKTPVAFFTLEMTPGEVCKRLVASHGRIDMKTALGSKLSVPEADRIFAAITEVGSSPIYVVGKPGITISQVRAEARRLVRAHGVKLVIVDYLQLLSSDKRTEGRVQEIAVMTGDLKKMALELNVPVIVLAQLNRDIEREKKERVPRFSDLREGGSIEQDSDMVIFLHVSADEDIAESMIVPTQMIISKHRNGPTGIVNLMFHRQFTKFTLAAKIDECDIPAPINHRPLPVSHPRKPIHRD